MYGLWEVDLMIESENLMLEVVTKLRGFRDLRNRDMIPNFCISIR